MVERDETETDSDLPSLPSPTDRVRVNVWVRRDLYDDIVVIGKIEDTSLTNIVKSALKDYVKKHQQPGV